MLELLISWLWWWIHKATDGIKLHGTKLSRKKQELFIVVKNLPANAGDIEDVGSIPESGRSLGGGHGNSLQYSCWKTPWTKEPGRLESTGSQRVGHSWSNLTCMRWEQIWFIEIYSADKHRRFCHWRRNQWWVSVQFSCSVVSECLQPQGMQHARLPCPLPTPGTSSDFIKSVMPSTHLILCCPFLLLSSVFPTIRLFFNESALRIIWPKYWSFSFNISHSNEYSGMISFKMNWLESPCRHSKIFSNTKSINSSALSSLYGPTLTCILDY